MLTFHEALAAAHKVKHKINKCVEYPAAYLFIYDDGLPGEGGETPVVVMKTDGEMVDYYPFYLEMVKTGQSLVRQFDVAS